MQQTENSQRVEWILSLAPWELTATFTFRGRVGFQTAAKQFELFMRSQARGVSYFYALESNPGRDGCHVHALMLGESLPVSRRSLWASWFKRHGRNRIEPIRDRANASAYCAKYLMKSTSWWMYKLFGECQRRLALAGTMGAKASVASLCEVNPEAPAFDRGLRGSLQTLTGLQPNQGGN